MRLLRLALPVIAALPLAACLSFGESPPDSLSTLTPTSAVPAGQARAARDGQTVIVAVPTVPQELSTPRIPVQSGATAIAYLKDAQWVDAPNRLFRDVLAETIQSRTAHAVLDPRQAAIAGGIRLGGKLTQFGLDSASRTAVAVYDATLVRGKDGASTGGEVRRFEARVPVTAETPQAVVPALNQAANQIAVDVADWIR